MVGLEDLNLHTLHTRHTSFPPQTVMGEEDGLLKGTILRRDSELNQGTTVIQSTNFSVETDTLANYEAFWYSSL